MVTYHLVKSLSNYIKHWHGIYLTLPVTGQKNLYHQPCSRAKTHNSQNVDIHKNELTVVLNMNHKIIPCEGFQ